MLGGLLKPKWQHKSPEIRRLAVEKMDAEVAANQTLLETIAAQDSERGVRLASIKKLQEPAALFSIFSTHTDSATKDAAESEFCKRISQSQRDIAWFKDLLTQQPETTLLVAEHCPHSELRHELISNLNENQQASLIADVAYLETRQFIAGKLSSLPALEAAKKNLKGKDKSSEKIIRHKLEKLRAQQKQEQGNQAAATELCEQMEFIANHPEWRAEFKDRHHLYLQRWQAFDFEPESEIKKRFTDARAKAEIHVAAQTKQEDAQTAQTQITEKLAQYLKAVAPLSLTALAEERLSINTVLSEALNIWLESGETVIPNETLANEFSGYQKALSSAAELANVEQGDMEGLGAVLKTTTWPKGQIRFEALSEARERHAQYTSDTAEQQKAAKENLDQLHKRINRLLGTTKKGDLRKAKHELSATTKAASHHTGKERKILDERLEQATETVNKMVDWQAFATEPKLIELCESMEALVNSKQNPEKLAKSINRLQTSWKSLGRSDLGDSYWGRFKAAADSAYEPCAVFFKERKEAQLANLAKREPLISRAQDLLDDTDWDKEPDYKQVELTLRDINNEWRSIKDVERKAGQKQWDKLGKIKDAIYAKLDPVYDANLELKQQLIKQVSALLDGEINDDVLGKLQLFQSRWKQIGVTRRKQDQAVWKEFKAVSDKVYEQLQGVRKAKRAEQDEQLQEYRDIIEQVFSLAKTTSELVDADKKFEALQSNYTALPELPKNLPEKLIEKVGADFQRANAAFQKARDKIIQAEKDSVITALKRKAQMCTKLEAAADAGDSEEVEALKFELQQYQIADKALDQRFNARLESALNSDRKAASEAREILCIELEILFEAESPKQYQAQRMQLQLERMQNKGLGHEIADKQKTVKELTLDWLCLPGAKPDIQTKLQARIRDFIKL